MIYLDATFFAIAVIDTTEKGRCARECIDVMNHHAGGRIGLTSLLTVDEVAYVVKRELGRAFGVKAGEAMLASNIQFIDVTRDIIGRALQNMKAMGLDPRDSLHAATMAATGVKDIVSEDSDFDRVPGITRMSISQFLVHLKKQK